MSSKITARNQLLRRFGDAVRTVREGKGWSQERLAAACGLDRTYVGGVERGERNIGLVNVVRLANALGVDPCKLVAHLGE